MFRRGKARSPALGTVNICSGSNDEASRREFSYGGFCSVLLSCAMYRYVTAVKAARGPAGFA